MNLSIIKHIITSVIVLTVLGYSALGQTINLKHYGIEEGLLHPSIYTISQDKNGFLWLGTGGGVCRFDGLKFSLPRSSDTISESYAKASYCDKSGNMWFGFDDGNIYKFSAHKLNKLLKKSEAVSVINGFSEDLNGTVIAISQNSGIYTISSNGEVKYILSGTENKLLYSIAKFSGNKFLLGTSDGLFIASINFSKMELVEEQKVAGIPSTKVQCIIPGELPGTFWIGTEDAGFFQIKEPKPGANIIVANWGEKYGLSEANIQSVLEDNQHNVWVCTFGNGLVKLLYNNVQKSYLGSIIYNQDNGLGDNYIKSAYQDTEGNIWIGTYSNGLSGIIDEAFVFYNFKADGFNDILSVTSDMDYFWLGSHRMIVRIDIRNPQNRKVYTEKNGLPADAISSLKINSNGLWIGTEKSGLYKLTLPGGNISRFFFTANSIENNINSIVEKNDVLWIATNGGLFSINLKTGAKEHFSTDNGLPHNRINDVFIDSKGIVWIATKGTGLVSVNSDKVYKIEGAGELEFTSITEDKKGNLWAASYGDGIFEFGKDSLRFLSEKDGLKSNYCYSLLTDEDGNIWIGHRLAVSKVNPVTHKVMTYGSEIGITGDCNPHSSNIDYSGALRFGTTDGLIQYNYQKNRQKLLPPSLNLVSVKISDKEIDFTDNIELKYGVYRMRFDFVGLNFRAPSSVKYQYKLEGWETEWSEISDITTAYYPRVEDGNFTFLIRAFNAEGISSEPLKFEISVSPPIWKRWWFILISIAALAGLLYAYIKYRERKQILFQQYLQKMLDERTREVVEQKEEIENKNRDITDSINYAQRIQASILPSIRKLQDTFSGCFIFYQPRDIVSGDFYWFDRITENKFVIVCGDSTGHGVPGALMSMIGTTLIKDICNRPDVVSPSNILEKLDEEMSNTLNQNIDVEQSSDGMDLTACEIDTETMIVKIASAMRPVILYQNGEQIYCQGSKNSIGGNEFGEEGKDFDNQEFQLSKGDLIYMFSDGYPDQFGGPMGKKFKMVRLRSLLKDIHQLPMEEQYHHVKNTFNLWRDQLDQIDDVLFMGIRL